MKQSQMNFKEIRLVLLLFFLCHPSTHPSSKTTQALLLNPEKEQENKKTAWFIRLRWDC